MQGVGFRPYVYMLAKRYHLTGYVKNEGAQVTIEIQGNQETIEHFYISLQREKPPAASIKESIRNWIPLKKDEVDFVIIPSRRAKSIFNYISPDLGICNKCLEELKNPENRRYQFHFINCTDCGPRFSIIKKLPYDRIQTTMASFGMCEACQKEYIEPKDRRFHAEPICCHECGPEIWISDSKGNQHPFSMPFIREKLIEGKIIALKGIGGFHLLCNAYDEKAVALLRKRKHRDQKPLALMAENLMVIKRYCKVSCYESYLLESSVKPILILTKKENQLSYLSESHTLGMMLPYTPLHVMLFGGTLDLLVATSGNLANEPICYDNEEGLQKLGNMADYFVMHNRDILRPIDDSIIRVDEEQMYVIRRARGLVPNVMDFSFIQKAQNTRSILAVGAEQKDTFCLTKGHLAIMSQHIGDLNNYESMQSFYRVKEQFKTLFEIRPEMIVGDKHPDYLSSYIVRKQSFNKQRSVQHHYAHIATCMTENQISHKVIGIAFDGTGYGDDGNIWGGEFFVCDLTGYERMAHFQYIPMPGGEQCIKEPWRMAKAYLYQYGLFKPASKEEELLYLQLTKDVNCPLTSSVGRLFDAVSALLGLCSICAYEAQAAILLEACCERNDQNRNTAEQDSIKKQEDHKYQDKSQKKIEKHTYPYTLIGEKPVVISCEPMIRGILEDVHKQMSCASISVKFHRTLVRIMVEICTSVRRQTGIKEVALGGGVFQNMVLARLAQDELQRAGFHVYRNHEIPTNDGGISLGQAAIIYQEEQNVSFSSGEN